MNKQVPDGLLTQAKYAEHRKENGLDGVSRQAVNKKVKSGALPVMVIDGVAYIDPEDADAAWAANSARPLTVKPGPEKGREVRDDDQARDVTTLTKVRIKGEGIRTLKAQAEYKQFVGTLVKRQDVERAAFAAMRITRDQLRGMAAKLAPPLAHAQTPQQVASIVNAEVREMLGELARKFREIPDAGRSISQGNQPATGYNGQ